MACPAARGARTVPLTDSGTRPLPQRAGGGASMRITLAPTGAALRGDVMARRGAGRHRTCGVSNRRVVPTELVAPAPFAAWSPSG